MSTLSLYEDKTAGSNDEESDDEEAGDEVAKKVPGYPHIRVISTTPPEPITDWSECRRNIDVQIHSAKTTANFALQQVLQAVPAFTKKDMTIVKVDGRYLVFTQRDFQKHEIALAPETTEVQDKYWTAQSGIATLAQNGPQNHPKGRNMVFSGRLRTTPSSTKPFALFWPIYQGSHTNNTKGKDVKSDGTRRVSCWSIHVVVATVDVHRASEHAVSTVARRVEHKNARHSSECAARRCRAVVSGSYKQTIYQTLSCFSNRTRNKIHQRYF